jgi:hypothetical protein
MSQTSSILKALKEAGNKGLTNYNLSGISLKYTNRISELRQSGNNIYTERQYLPNGRATGTWRYYLND